MFDQRLLTLSVMGDDSLYGGPLPLSARASAVVPVRPLSARAIGRARPVWPTGARSARRITSATAITAIVPRLALLHLIVGGLGVVSGVVLWYLLDPTSHLPALVCGDALLLAVCPCAALVASGVSSRRSEFGARLVLLAADLIVGALALGLLGLLGSASAPAWLAALSYPLGALLLLAPFLATALFSPRIGVVALAVGVVLVPLATLVWPVVASGTSLPIDAFGSTPHLAPQGAVWGTVLSIDLALIVGGGLAIWCWWATHRSTERAFATFAESLALAQARENALESERANLTETIHRQAAEHLRTQQHLADLCRQVGALAAIAERLAAGDLSATHALDPTLQEPLASLAAALGMLAQRIALTTNTQARARQMLAEKLAAALEDQRETLATLEHAVRAGSYDAEALVVALDQTRTHFASSAPGTETPTRDSASVTSDEERHHLAGRLAEGTKHSVAWVAHMHGRHGEMQQTMRQLTRLLTAPAEPSVDEADTLALGASDLRRVLANRWASSAVTSARPLERQGD